MNKLGYANQTFSNDLPCLSEEIFMALNLG